MACKVNDGTNEYYPIGMNGKWSVTQLPLDEAGAGRGVCTVFPEFTMRIDSGAVMSVSIPTKESLVCRGAGVTTDSVPLDGTLRMLDLGAGLQHAVVFRVTARPEELVAFGWPDIDGDSIGGPFINLDTAGSTTFGQSTWSATRP